MADAKWGSLTFREQIDFFRRKLSLPTRAWTDIWEAQHDRSFVVAGAVKADLLADLRAAVDKAIGQGTTLQEFRRDFDRIVSTYGWRYNGSRGWRTRVIYETNLRTSYMAGRLVQMRQVTRTRPYWRYRHNDAVEHPRPQHQAWDGLVLAADSPWWQTHYPPNGWGCRCFVETMSKRDLAKLGKGGPDEPPPIEWEERSVGQLGPSPRTVRVPKGIDPGWGYAPGESWMRAMTPPALDAPIASISPAVAALDALPAPRAVAAPRVLPAALPDDDYIRAFLAEFGIGQDERQAVFEDVTGEHLLISDRLFRDAAGAIKIAKRGRERYVLLYADAIREPDEIWQDWGEFGGKTVLRRRYVARFAVEGGQVPALAVFETGPQGWVGVTAFAAEDVATLDRSARRGTRIYRREGEG